MSTLFDATEHAERVAALHMIDRTPTPQRSRCADKPMTRGFVNERSMKVRRSAQNTSGASAIDGRTTRHAATPQSAHRKQ